MSDVSIRSLCGSDLAPVLAVWNRALRRDPIDEARFARTILADPDYWPGDDSGFLVATLDDTVVGFCRAIIRRWPNDRLGLEPDDGWIPVIAVDPERHRLGIGSALVSAALDYFRRQRRSRIWVCGTTTSAPGSIVPGVDEDGYPSARPLFEKFQFVADQDAFSMAREIVDFDVHAYGQDAWATGANVAVTSLTPEAVHDLFAFLADALPGSWNIAARAKIQRGDLHEVLIARSGARVVGYCQWSGEHFGPFGVAPAERSQRIGAKLFVEAVRRIRDAGGRHVWFNWADSNARRFYERFGLTVTRRFTVLRKEL